MLRLLLLSALIVAFISPASAFSLEITPFTGYRIGDSFEEELTETKVKLAEGASYGLVINHDVAPNGQFELYYSRQATSLKTGPALPDIQGLDLDVDYLHIGGASIYNTGEKFTPFIAAGIGATHLDLKDFDSETKFSLSIGGGGKYHFTENVGLRLEVRGFWTIFDSKSVILCNNTNCLVFIEGSTWWQVDTHVGLFMRF